VIEPGAPPPAKGTGGSAAGGARAPGQRRDREGSRRIVILTVEREPGDGVFAGARLPRPGCPIAGHGSPDGAACVADETMAPRDDFPEQGATSNARRARRSFNGRACRRRGTSSRVGDDGQSELRSQQRQRGVTPAAARVGQIPAPWLLEGIISGILRVMAAPSPRGREGAAVQTRRGRLQIPGRYLRRGQRRPRPPGVLARLPLKAGTLRYISPRARPGRHNRSRRPHQPHGSLHRANR